jgi:hypothetical protein
MDLSISRNCRLWANKNSCNSLLFMRGVLSSRDLLNESTADAQWYQAMLPLRNTLLKSDDVAAAMARYHRASTPGNSPGGVKHSFQPPSTSSVLPVM